MASRTNSFPLNENDMFETPEKVDYHVEKWFDNTDEALADAIARHIRINKDV